MMYYIIETFRRNNKFHAVQMMVEWAKKDELVYNKQLWDWIDFENFHLIPVFYVLLNSRFGAKHLQVW